MRLDRQQLDASGHVRRPIAYAVPRGRRICVGWREPQVADGWPSKRYSQVRPSPVTNLIQRQLGTGHSALPADVDDRRFSVTTAGPLSHHRAVANKDERTEARNQQLRTPQQRPDPMTTCTAGGRDR